MTTHPAIVIPPALKLLIEHKRWVIWRYEITATGKRTKVPYQGRTPHKHADTIDPPTWCDLKTAMLAYTEGKCDGIGFVLTDSQFSAVDIDDCRNAETAEIHPWAAEQIKQANSYAEITPSNEGVRIIGLGIGEPLHCAFELPNANGVRCELYRKAERYITISGREIGAAMSLINIDARLDALHAELGGETAQESRLRPQKDSRLGALNELALANLGKWVPKLFPTAKRTRAGGYRVKSADLGRSREEDLSFTPKGIKYFGDADMGDPRKGRRTPIEVIVEFQHVERPQAAAWLEKALASQGNGAAAPEPPKPEPQTEAATEADVEITRLAKLSLSEYEREREAAAKKLKFRASILDKVVAAERERLNPDDGSKQGHAIAFPDPEPWPDPVAGAALLDDLAAAIRNHVVLSDHARDACAIWVVHTYLADRFLISPRLGVRSPMRGCGKTTLLDVLDRLVARPLPTTNVTAAAIFRVIEAHRPTLLVDEADTFLRDNDELRGVLNSGHRKGGAVLRTVGDDHEPRSFATYAPCVIALIGALPDTLHDRAVTVDLKRRLPSEKVEPFRPDRAGHLDVLARKAARWAKDNADRMDAADPVMPDGLVNRAADNWRPLLAIADVAEGEWPERGRKAAEASRNAEADDGSRLELLLGDIRNTFAGKGEVPSADLVKALIELEGHPWAELGKNRKPLTQNRLARMLKPLGIAPKKIGPGKERVNGYVCTHFEEAFGRYLGSEGGSQPDNWTECDEIRTSENLQPDSPEQASPVAKCEKPSNDGLPSGCPVAKGGNGAARAPSSLDDGVGVSAWRIRQLAEQYQDRAYANAQANDGDTRTADCDAWLRQTLAEMVLPEFVEGEFKRVMTEVFRF
jgi:hypothetical protein